VSIPEQVQIVMRIIVEQLKIATTGVVLNVGIRSLHKNRVIYVHQVTGNALYKNLNFFILFFSEFIFINCLKHSISSGVGACVNTGTSTNSNNYYCGQGSDCNNWSGFECWNPVTGGSTGTACTSGQWQCKVLK